MANQKSPKIVDHVSDSSDEEIDEDDAFNSDDERKYGSLFKIKHDGKSEKGNDDDSSEASYDESSDGLASEDDDDDGDGGQYMLNLLKNLDSKEDNQMTAKESARKVLAHSTVVPESEFSSLHKNKTLTLDQLMNSISDTKGFKDVQKTMKDMVGEDYDGESRLKTTKAPLPKVISNRLERKVNYQEQSEEVSLWTNAVKQNREAETLDFRPQDRIKISKDELVGKFEPSTDFEKEMAAALEEAGAADEDDIKRKEGVDLFGDDDDLYDDDLGRNKLSVEEFKKRHSELAKLRALMFYEEQKRHHMNKIKSKKYRKIRKKQKLRMKDAEDEEAAEHDRDFAADIDEKAEMERMKERMSLKHRNTSKWAKSVLRRGKNIDLETRRALSEQVRVGNELKRKMESNFSEDDDDVDDDDDNSSALIKQARDILAQAENEDLDEKRKGLFKLDFMRKGLDAQRERAKEEARELLRELEANHEFDIIDEEHSNTSDTNIQEPTTKSVSSSKEMDTVLSKGKLVASTLEFGQSKTVIVAGGIDLDTNPKSISHKNGQSDATNVRLSSISTTDDAVIADRKKISISKTVQTESHTQVADEESNPWIRKIKPRNVVDDDTLKHSKRKSAPKISKQGIINVSDVANVVTGPDESGDKHTHSALKSTIEIEDSKIFNLSQEELVKKAFATLSEKDIDDEFRKEKNLITDREDHSKKDKDQDKKVSGWGTWAGEGAPPPKPPRKLPKKLAAPEKKAEKRPRLDDGKKNVIISAKRVKKAAKFQVENVPFPFTSREQYERAINGAIGAEWNVSTAVKNFTRPEVITRAGKMIRPISKKVKAKRAPLVKFKSS